MRAGDGRNGSNWTNGRDGTNRKIISLRDFSLRKEALWMFVCCDSALLVGYFASRINGLSLS